MKSVKIFAVTYVGLLTIFALLSGAGDVGIMANIPNVAPWLLGWVAVLVAWKYPDLGGMLFMFLAVASVFFFHTYQELIPFLIVSLPLAVIGVLFMRKQK